MKSKHLGEWYNACQRQHVPLLNVSANVIFASTDCCMCVMHLSACVNLDLSSLLFSVLLCLPPTWQVYLLDMASTYMQLILYCQVFRVAQ